MCFSCLNQNLHIVLKRENNSHEFERIIIEHSFPCTLSVFISLIISMIFDEHIHK